MELFSDIFPVYQVAKILYILSFFYKGEVSGIWASLNGDSVLNCLPGEEVTADQ